MKEKGQDAKLKEFMGKMYESYAVKERIDEIVVDNKEAGEDGGSYSAVTCST